MEFPFAYSHHVERPRDPARPPADAEAALAAVARRLNGRPDVSAAVAADEVRFRVSFLSASLAFGGVRCGSVRAEPGAGTLVLRYRMEFARWPIAFLALAGAAFSTMDGPRIGGIVMAALAVALLHGTVYILKPLAFEDTLREVPIPGHPHQR